MAASQDGPITLDGLQLLLSRESASEPPQTHLITFHGPDAATNTQALLTNFPHPYPQVCGSSAALQRSRMQHTAAQPRTHHSAPCITWL